MPAGNGEALLERQLEQQALIVAMLRENEADLLEIFIFYSMLSQVPAEGGRQGGGGRGGGGRCSATL